jgi:hypothetical protein
MSFTITTHKLEFKDGGGFYFTPLFDNAEDFKKSLRKRKRFPRKLKKQMKKDGCWRIRSVEDLTEITNKYKTK